jgi:hypothetical protein
LLVGPPGHPWLGSETQAIAAVTFTWRPTGDYSPGMLGAWLRPRGILALVTGLALLGSAGEALVPETHDGDSQMAVQHPGSPAPDRPTQLPGHSPESPHVCHCLHAHVAAPSADRPLSQPVAAHPAVPVSPHRALPTPPVAYHFRPPIA